MATDRPTTVGQLISSVLLNEAELLAGEPGLGGRIADVVLRTRVDKESAMRAGEMVVFDAQTIGDHQYQVDIAIRVCAEAEAAALVVVNHDFDIGLGSVRLANRFALPLLSLAGIEAGATTTDAMALTQRLRDLIWAADVEQAAVVNELLTKLHAMHLTDIGEVLALIKSLSAAAVSLIDRDRAHIAGDEISLDDRRLATHNAYHIDRLSGTAVHSTVIVLTPGEEVAYWLVGESSGSDGAQRLLRTLLQITAWYLAALLGSARVSALSDSRRRIAALNEILNTGELVEQDIQHQLNEMGWSANGWNTGIQIKLRGADAGRIVELHEELLDRLREEGIDGPLVERNDGWSGWITHQSEPAVEGYAATVQLVSKVLEAFVGVHPTLEAHAGIGRPYVGLEGLRRSLTEANEAATIANARSGASQSSRSGAAHIDRLGVQRVLMGWFSSEDFARYAKSIIQPILNIDPNHELLRTLEVFLDSSCSTTNAAHKLSVHRNTVSNRIRKISDVLGADFEDPETRLSLQLACRVLRISR